MVHKINFEQKYEQLKSILIERRANFGQPALDPEVMTDLGFSPPSWKTWKPQLLTMAQKPIEVKRDDDGRITDIFYIRYDKKEKSWSIEHEKNLIHVDPNE